MIQLHISTCVGSWLGFSRVDYGDFLVDGEILETIVKKKKEAAIGELGQKKTTTYCHLFVLT